MEEVNAAKVPAAEASDIIPLMRAKGMIDLSQRISGEPGYRLVPLAAGREEEASRMGFEIVRIASRSEGSLTPMERITGSLPGVEGLPDRWELAGDTVTLKLDPSLADRAEAQMLCEMNKK